MTRHEDPRPAAASGPGKWRGLSLLALSLASGAALMTVFSPLQELAKADLRLSDLQIGLVQGLAVSIPIALLSLPIGRLIDRGNRTRLLVAMLVVSIVGTLLTAYAQSFEALFMARMLAGLGAFCSVPVAISIAADLSAVAQRGQSLLLLSVGRYVGVASAFALGGWLGGALASSHAPWLPGLTLAAWREVHVVFGLAGAVLLLPLLFMREPVRHELGNVVDPDTRTALAALWERRAFLLPLFVGQIGVVMADISASIWAAPVLTRRFGLQPEEFAAAIGLAVLLSGILGSIIGGLAADAGQRRSHWGGILLVAVIAAVLALPGALFPSMPTANGAIVGLSWLLLCGSITGLVTATAIAVHVPNELRGVCLGLFVVVSSVVALGVAPTLVTLVSGTLGGEAHLPDALSITGFTISILAAAAFVRAAARLPRRSIADEPGGIA